MCWLKHPGVLASFWQCLDDTEAYVRASAILAIGHLYKVKDMWEQFTQDISWEKVRVICEKLVLNYWLNISIG